MAFGVNSTSDRGRADCVHPVIDSDTGVQQETVDLRITNTGTLAVQVTMPVLPAIVNMPSGNC